LFKEEIVEVVEKATIQRVLFHQILSNILHHQIFSIVILDTSYLPKLATPTISFGDKMAGLKEVSTLKFFSPAKKQSQEKSGDTNLQSSEGDNLQGFAIRKNSSDTLKNAITVKTLFTLFQS